MKKLFSFVFVSGLLVFFLTLTCAIYADETLGTPKEELEKTDTGTEKPAVSGSEEKISEEKLLENLLQLYKDVRKALLYGDKGEFLRLTTKEMQLSVINNQKVFLQRAEKDKNIKSAVEKMYKRKYEELVSLSDDDFLDALFVFLKENLSSSEKKYAMLKEISEYAIVSHNVSEDMVTLIVKVSKKDELEIIFKREGNAWFVEQMNPIEKKKGKK